MIYQLETSYGRFCVAAQTLRNDMYALAFWVAALNGVALYVAYDQFTCGIIGGVAICGTGVVALLDREKRIAAECVTSETSTEVGRLKACLTMLRLRSECLADESRNNNYRLTCLLAYHYSHCKIESCPVTALMAADRCDPLKHRAEMLDAVLHSVNKMLKDFVVTRPNAARLILFYLFFAISCTKDSLLIWGIYARLKRSPTITMIDKYLLYRTLYLLSSISIP